jgi:hypothetical protein
MSGFLAAGFAMTDDPIEDQRNALRPLEQEWLELSDVEGDIVSNVRGTFACEEDVLVHHGRPAWPMKQKEEGIIRVSDTSLASTRCTTSGEADLCETQSLGTWSDSEASEPERPRSGPRFLKATKRQSKLVGNWRQDQCCSGIARCNITTGRLQGQSRLQATCGECVAVPEVSKSEGQVAALPVPHAPPEDSRKEEQFAALPVPQFTYNQTPAVQIYQLEPCAKGEFFVDKEEEACLSIGSLEHHAGTCTPCKFHRSRRGCRMGELCNLCHHPHEELTHSGIRKAMRLSAQAKREQRAALEAEEEAKQCSRPAPPLPLEEQPQQQQPSVFQWVPLKVPASSLLASYPTA